MTASNTVVRALTALRDAALVTDRDALNAAWRELEHGVPTVGVASPVGCQRPSCTRPAVPYIEPAGRWCPQHRPQLWRDPVGSPWACPRCVRCGCPARYPHGRYGTDPVCRAHVPVRMRRYLAQGGTP